MRARAICIYLLRFLRLNFSEAFLTKTNHCIKMRLDGSSKRVCFDKSYLRSTLPRIPGVQTASFLSMSGWHFFGYLKLLTVEPPSNSEMAHSYFLLRGRLAFVWRETHIVGWLSTVGERSVLVIRPYLCRLNQLFSLADTIGSPFFHPSFEIFIQISGDSFRENYRYKLSSGFPSRVTIKISHNYKGL